MATDTTGQEVSLPEPARTPVLLLVFNRPDTTREVFDVLRRVRPRRLYVAADGPRSDRDGETAKCAEARAIATDVDWDCEMRTLFRDGNLGCARAVSGAIDWFFTQEEQGIILEDDCVVSESWFPFAAEMLDRYRDDERIVGVAAEHFHLGAHQPAHSYFFSIIPHCWGWATWRRSWAHYDHDMKQWPELSGTSWLREIGDGNRLFARHWGGRFQTVYENRLDSWAFRWTFSCWTRDGLTIHPNRNLVRNIGFRADATHTTRQTPMQERMVLQTMTFPLSHPTHVAPDRAADRWTTVNQFNITTRRFLRQDLRRVPPLRAILDLKHRFFHDR